MSRRPPHLISLFLSLSLSLALALARSLSLALSFSLTHTERYSLSLSLSLSLAHDLSARRLFCRTPQSRSVLAGVMVCLDRVVTAHLPLKVTKTTNIQR